MILSMCPDVNVKWPHGESHVSTLYYACVLMKNRMCPHFIMHVSSEETKVGSWGQTTLVQLCRRETVGV